MLNYTRVEKMKKK